MGSAMIFWLLLCGINVQRSGSVYKDVIWLFDISSSVSISEQQLVKDFMYNVTSYLTIGTSDIRMAVITFDVETKAEFKLDANDDKGNLLTAIHNIPEYQNRVADRKTMDALTFAQNSQFLELKGGRAGASKTVIAILSGTSTDTLSTIANADSLRNQYTNTEIFAIGIGQHLSAANTELRGIANDPDSYYLEYIGGYTYLCGLIPSLVYKIDNTTNVTLGDGCEVWEDEIITTEEVTTTTETNVVYVAKINEGLSAGGIAGLVLAVLFLLILLALLLYLFCRRKKKQVKHTEVPDDDNVLRAVRDYKDAGLGEPRYAYKRDLTNVSIKHEKFPFENSSLPALYENLGERCATEIKIKI